MLNNKLPPLFRISPFWLTAALSLAAYIAIRFWFPLSPFYNRFPLPDIRTFTPSAWEGLAYAAWLCLIFALYGVAYRSAKRMDRPPSMATILVVAFLFALPLIQTFPFNATDVYRYNIRGRISSVYGKSPFSIPPDAFPQDSLLPLAGEWANATSPYGPIWETAAAAITSVSQDELLLALILFKVFGLVIHLMVAVLTWRLSEDANPGTGSAHALLWAWNPALLMTFVVDAHNDALMIFWLLFGFWMVRRGRPEIGFVLLVMAPLTKPVAILLLPVFFLKIWRQLPGTAARVRFMAFAGTGSVALIYLSFLPFGSPLDLVMRLANEASGGASFSAGALLVLAVRSVGYPLSLVWVSNGAMLLFALVMIWFLWLTWQGRQPVRVAADVFIAYIVQASNFRIWYAVWPFPWLLLDMDGSREASFRLRIGLWLLTTAQLSVLIYGHLRVFLLGGDPLIAHLIGVPFTFGIPLILAWGMSRLDRRI